MITINRRGLLRNFSGLVAASAIAGLPRFAFAAPKTEQRLVVVVLRGALDGLAAVPAYGDPAYAGQRGALALSPANGLIDLNGTFGLNPGLAGLKPLYDSGQFAIIHAVASPYRDRSHFEAQNVLETGLNHPSGAAEGWLNRALAFMPARAEGGAIGLAATNSMPLILRGDQKISGWEPGVMRSLDQSFLDQVASLYTHDVFLSTALNEGVQSAAFNKEVLESGSGVMTDNAVAKTAITTKTVAAGETPAGQEGGEARNRAANAVTVKFFDAAGRLLGAPDGPRVAVVEMTGWDTHAGQGAEKGRLKDTLTQLSNALLALKSALGQAWNSTAVVVATEFGRTVAINGTGGTDHGTGTAMLLLGGAIKGRQVIANWPGLGASQLYQNRDLMPTTDLRSPLKAVLINHFGIAQSAVEQKIFPDSAAAAPTRNLLV